MSQNELKKILKSKDYDETRYHTEGNLYGSIYVTSYKMV